MEMRGLRMRWRVRRHSRKFVCTKEMPRAGRDHAERSYARDQQNGKPPCGGALGRLRMRGLADLQRIDPVVFEGSFDPRSRMRSDDRLGQSAVIVSVSIRAPA